MTYNPPALAAAGSTLHQSVTALLASRGIDEPTRDDYLAAADEVHARVDAHRPASGSPPSWTERRKRENSIGLAAHSRLLKRQPEGYSAEQYHAEYLAIQNEIERKVQ